MPLIQGITRGLGALADTGNKAFDELERQKEIKQLRETNEARLKQANQQIAEADRVNKERDIRERANQAVTQYTVGGSLEGVNKFINERAAEGNRFNARPNQDGTVTIDTTLPNGTTQTRTVPKDKVPEFVYASTVVDPIALLADDIQRDREAEAAKAQHLNEINKIMLEGKMAERLEKMKSGRASGKVPEYEKIYMKLAKEALGAQLGDQWNFEGKNARKAAWVSNYAAILHDRALAQGLNPNTTTIWNQAFAALESQVGEDFLISKEEAELRSGNKLGAPHTGRGPSARQRFEKGRPEFPILPDFGFETPGLGAKRKAEEKTSSQAPSPSDGASRPVSAGARASLVGASPRALPAGAVPNGGLSEDQMPKPSELPPLKPQDIPSGDDVFEQDGIVWVRHGTNADGTARHVDMRQHPDGTWWARDPKTGDFTLRYVGN